MIRKYKIPFKTKGYAEVIKIPQYDTGYEVVFDVRDLPEGTTTLDGYSAVVEGSRSDGLAYEFQCTVSGTHVSFTIDTTCTGCPGRGEARIRFLLSGEEIAANKIIIEIEKSSVPDGAVDADVTEARAIAEQVQEIVDTAADRVEAVYSELVDRVTTLEQGGSGLAEVVSIKGDIDSLTERVTEVEGNIPEHIEYTWQYTNIGINANRVYSATKSIAKAGYTPTGIKGYRILNNDNNGKNASWCVLPKLWIDGNSMEFTIWNQHLSQQAIVKIQIKVEYVSNNAT